MRFRISPNRARLESFVKLELYRQILDGERAEKLSTKLIEKVSQEDRTVNRLVEHHCFVCSEVIYFVPRKNGYTMDLRIPHKSAKPVPKKEITAEVPKIDPTDFKVMSRNRYGEHILDRLAEASQLNRTSILDYAHRIINDAIEAE